MNISKKNDFNYIIYYFYFYRNSKPLDSMSGYWADPLPVIESPLCAVIDPVRDFRWHALRCGGPETAAFLCEMDGLYILNTIIHCYFIIFLYIYI